MASDATASALAAPMAKPAKDRKGNIIFDLELDAQTQSIDEISEILQLLLEVTAGVGMVWPPPARQYCALALQMRP